MEIGNGFTELNDPAEQRARFEEARVAAAAGDDEAAADGRGLPAGARVRHAADRRGGIGIDRLMMPLTGIRSIREVILFPPSREGS